MPIVVAFLITRHGFFDLWPLVLAFKKQVINDWDHIKRQHSSQSQACDHRPCHTFPKYSAKQAKRQQPTHCCHGGQQNGPKPHDAGLDDSLLKFQTFFQSPLNKFSPNHGIFDDYSSQRCDTQKAMNEKLLPLKNSPKIAQ